MLPGISWVSGASTSTNAITPVMAPAVCRMMAPIASANRPSMVRYSPPPKTARATPGSPSDTGAWLCRMAAPMKNDGNVTHSPITNTSAANTTTLAASIGIRRGTASSDALITPVEYSLVITSTPSTQMVSCPNSSPEPRIVLTGSATIWACWLGSDLSHCSTVSQVNSAVNPSVSTMSKPSDQTVDRTDRILVHSASSRWPKPGRPAASPAAVACGPAADADAVTWHSLRPWRPLRPGRPGPAGARRTRRYRRSVP
jgi:hypothetical protein